MRESGIARPVRLAVVGHTNTGKTSLMRTLARDTGFGEVSSRPSTTRHVEGVRLMADGEVLVELYDTPGMEDAIALLELVEKMGAEAGERLDGPARIERFLASTQARGRFEQEAKVLRQLLASDAGLYVVDARDPVLAKHRDELAILGACAVPLLPVLNFVSSPDANESAWREALSRLGLHSVVRFDTVAPERDGERRLYEKLGTVLDVWQPALERLIACREREAQERHLAALRLVAGLLVDVAAARMRIDAGDEVAERGAVAALSEDVRRQEQRCVDALLALYRFPSDDVDADTLPLADGRWEHDLFHPETVRDMGVKLGTGAAAGACRRCVTSANVCSVSSPASVSLRWTTPSCACWPCVSCHWWRRWRHGVMQRWSRCATVSRANAGVRGPCCRRFREHGGIRNGRPCSAMRTRAHANAQWRRWWRRSRRAGGRSRCAEGELRQRTLSRRSRNSLRSSRPTWPPSCGSRAAGIPARTA
jgi:small GTP-binding protein